MSTYRPPTASPSGMTLVKASWSPSDPSGSAIWSAAPDARFVTRLKAAGFLVDEVAVKARQNGKGPRHVIWFATRG